MNALRPFVAILVALLTGYTNSSVLQAQTATATVAAPVGKAVSAPPVWLGDYATAKQISKETNKMLVLWFYNPANAQSNANFENSLMGNASVQQELAKMVAVKIPTDAKILSAGKETSLLSHSAFSELAGGPGLAMIDLTDSRMPYYGYVVSAYPFNRQTLSAGSVLAMLTLPSGTVTQRTLTLAVRMHPEAPQSAWGSWHPTLGDLAQQHSKYQANVQQIGHQGWDSRFQHINSTLGGMPAKEVCAQSWPQEGLVVAAEDCVNSWRQSPGHWEGVRGAHSYFGYDMKMGNNGIWYATGIFAGSR